MITSILCKNLPLRSGAVFSCLFMFLIRPVLWPWNPPGQPVCLPAYKAVYAAQEDGLVSYSARPKDTGVDLPFRPLTPGWAPEGFVRDPDKTKATGHAVFSYHSQEDPDNLYFYIDQWHGEEQNGLFAGNFTLEDVEVDVEPE
jgi:hypothetical protein